MEQPNRLIRHKWGLRVVDDGSAAEAKAFSGQEQEKAARQNQHHLSFIFLCKLQISMGLFGEMKADQRQSMDVGQRAAWSNDWDIQAD